MIIFNILFWWLGLGWLACAIGHISDCIFLGIKRVSNNFSLENMVWSMCMGPFTFIINFLSWYMMWKGRDD